MRVRIAGGARGIDIGRDPHRQRGRAHDAGDARQDRYGDRDDQVDIDAADGELAECRHHHQRQDDQRESQQDIDETLNPGIDPAAEIGRCDAENGAERRTDE